MTAMNLNEAPANLQSLVLAMNPGEELLLNSNGEPVAKVVKLARTSWPCKAGSAKDTIHWMAPDFDAPLEEFKEYME